MPKPYDEIAARRQLESALRKSMPETPEKVKSAEELFTKLVEILREFDLDPQKNATNSGGQSYVFHKFGGAVLECRGAQIVFVHPEKPKDKRDFPIPLIWSTQDHCWEGEAEDFDVVPVPGALRPRRAALDVLVEEVLDLFGIVKRKPTPTPSPSILPPG